MRDNCRTALSAVHMPVRPPVLEDYPGLAASIWGWTAETGGHALRLVLSGLFDRCPKLTVILGHMGEVLPYVLWRLDSRFKMYRPNVELEKRPSEYIRRNFFATTADACQTEALICAVQSLGANRVMFSVDYPLEDSGSRALYRGGAHQRAGSRDELLAKRSSSPAAIIESRAGINSGPKYPTA
jgi:2,3-dihydroxybenzoate decarboxylase